MLSNAELIAFVATVDGARARRFYEGTLGLRVVSDDDFALVLDASGTMLRVQKVQDVGARPFTALGWAVTGIRGVVEGLKARGVEFQIYPGMGQDDCGIWAAPSGAKVAWFKDPDGNVLSLTEM
jgi:catechol 2,3-dioxygenase-like lactoylglutathione lyase family enzyme